VHKAPSYTDCLGLTDDLPILQLHEHTLGAEQVHTRVLTSEGYFKRDIAVVDEVS
jgi:hypothetical protein